MPSLRRKRGPMHEINIVPYVDVMLVLLVIFMVTAPLVTPSIIDLPSVDKASAPRIVPLEVSGRKTSAAVKGSRLVFLKDGPHGLNWTHAEELNAALLELLAN